MNTRPLGRTGLQVSTLSFGASSLGGIFHAVDETDAIRAVHAALDCGINYFDVAPAYGGTRSETLLGKALVHNHHNHHSLHDTRMLELLPLAQEKGIGLINASPFGSGLLTDRGPADWHPANPEQRAVFKQAAKTAPRGARGFRNSRSSFPASIRTSRRRCSTAPTRNL